MDSRVFKLFVVKDYTFKKYIILIHKVVLSETHMHIESYTTHHVISGSMNWSIYLHNKTSSLVTYIHVTALSNEHKHL